MKYLFLSSHPDDVELVSGATIARLSSEGHQVEIAVFSDCDIDLAEMYKSHKTLGANTHYFSFPRREFDKHRQEILDCMIRARSIIKPDIVFLPDQLDIHQDHQVIGMEGIRAFRKNSDIIAYAHAHNHFENHCNYFVAVDQEHIKSKLAALNCYVSQWNRFYFQPAAVEAIMRYYGIQAHVPYAEGFRIIKQTI